MWRVQWYASHLDKFCRYIIIWHIWHSSLLMRDHKEVRTIKFRSVWFQSLKVCVRARTYVCAAGMRVRHTCQSTHVALLPLSLKYNLRTTNQAAQASDLSLEYKAWIWNSIHHINSLSVLCSMHCQRIFVCDFIQTIRHKIVAYFHPIMFT
jgi:hypothetical protein